MFQHNLPEQAENPLPAALAGETVTATTLHRFRLRQLQDLAKAYDIAIPADATKNQIVPIMVSHEQAGVFRQPPKSRYHFLRAEMNHDEKIEPRARAEREQALAQALAAETPNAPKAKPERGDAPVRQAKPSPDFLTQADLRKRAKALGINCYGKSNDTLRELIAAKDADSEPAATPLETAGE